MNPDVFLSKMDSEGGIAPLNRFVARIYMPDRLRSGSEEALSFLCDTAPLPGKTIATSELRHYGPTRKLAREATFPELQLSFIVTNSMHARNVFLNWMNYIIDPATANIRYQDDYKGIVEVLMFGPDAGEINKQDAIAGAKYLEAFPTNVDPIALGWDQINQLGKFSVNFQYKNWIDFNASGPGDFEVGEEGGL